MKLTYYISLLFLLASGTVQAQSVYLLGSGDSISIVVFDEAELSMDVRISDTPNVSYPFLGQITVLGRSVTEVEQEITDGLRGDYLIEPRVSISVIGYRPFFLAGEVKSPGGYPFQPGLTLRKAITLGGGFTERASKSKIYVTRGSNEDAKQKIKLDDPVFPDDVVTIEQSFF